MITVRSGNPEGIKSFEDLLTKDVDVVTPNPFSSGAARWNIMAVYGTALNDGKSPDEALAAVKTVLEKTVAQPGSARDALAAFTQGQGDVLLGYENEAIKAEEEGEDIEYVVPPSTIQIETPIAVTKAAPEPAAQDFLDFIWSDEGQEIWAENGYRPVNPKLVDEKQFPTPADLFTIDQFGGWGKVNDEFFDDETGSVAEDREGTRSLDQRLMEAHPATLPTPTEHRAGIRLPGLGVGLGRGMVVLYLSLMVLLPLAAVVERSRSPTASGTFWDQVTSPLAVATPETDRDLPR